MVVDHDRPVAGVADVVIGHLLVIASYKKEGEARLGTPCSGGWTEHGSDYGNPNPYGGNKPAPVPKTASPPPMLCAWGAWSKWGGDSGCGKQQSRSRFCSCSDGSYGAPGRCGGGSTREARPGTPCTQAETPKWTPKPYQKRKM